MKVGYQCPFRASVRHTAFSGCLKLCRGLIRFSGATSRAYLYGSYPRPVNARTRPDNRAIGHQETRAVLLRAAGHERPVMMTRRPENQVIFVLSGRPQSMMPSRM